MCSFCKKDACPRWPTLLKRASLHAFFAKTVSLLTYPIGKGVPMCIFRKEVCMSLLVYPVEKAVSYTHLRAHET